MKIDKLKVLENLEIGKNFFRLKLERGELEIPQIGQFYMLKPDNVLLRRPLSIHHQSKKSLFFYYEKKGKGTKKLSKLRFGEYISVQGPLGNGFEITKNKKILLLMGGMGIAPFRYVIDTLHKKNNLTLLAGAKNEQGLKIMATFHTKNVKIIKITQDGSIGLKGDVVSILKTLLMREKFDLILSCGPTIMMKKITKVAFQIPHFVSLERNMACGEGACMGCSIKTILGMKKVCQDGPVFDAKEVFYE